MQDASTDPNEPGPDYVTVLPAVHPDKACVAIMSWNYSEHEYAIKKCSDAIPRNAAIHLADSWAAAMRLEIR